jgi:hypothetical protein
LADPCEAPVFPPLSKTLGSPLTYLSYLVHFATLPLLAPFAGFFTPVAEVGRCGFNL